ncbi:hypothetical protein CYMTET_7243 [Cymbomonas tetramitiformis]|uniref:cGMP-dependent protein kinase n=1 Tax=Cymbomonas tetramitiformis TaxID=36881 RepID=A0AAE0LH25_9CHLO|nr:hypothetical protein CYMTET_7243 [Cymbomonas tetramitiformis]
MKGSSSGIQGPIVTSGPLSQKEYNTRIVSSGTPQDIVVPDHGYSIKYAYVSQRGYYPEALDKANQDAYAVHTSFGGDPNTNFFGVFDGHGEYGTVCAQFAKDRVPQNMLKDPNFRTDLKKTFHKAFVDSNAQLHRHHIDDSMSGTTGICVVVKGKSLLVANVGDSRACCGEKIGKKLVAVDLSHDQTPFRQDECVRVKKCGARVLTLDQLEGLKDPDIQCWGNEEDDDGDPPRLWAQNGMYPGTAFTRSIGDAAAEKIGVFAEPEFLYKELNPDCKLVVIASDGVFEFLSSQAVIDMVSKFDDIQEACNAVVAESYRLWLQYETRTDDITVIILQIIGMTETSVETQVRAQSGRKFAGVDVGANRPVRRNMSKQRRASIQQNTEADFDDDPYTPPTNLPAKSPEELTALAEAVKANFLFSHLNENQRKLIFDVMEKQYCKPGEVVIQQGDPGDNFYVVDKGDFEVYVLQETREGKPPENQHIHTYSTAGGVHPSFGELALMYGKPRAATVISKHGGSVWRLDRRAFKGVLHKKDNKSIIKVLRSVEVLQSLNVGQLQRLADTLTEETFEDGHYIIKQGDVGNEFYILNKGQVVCTVRKDPSNLTEHAKEVLRLGPNQYFGERALLGNAKRAANVIAKGRVKCLYIGRFAFEECLGPLQHIINADRKWREKCAQQKEGNQRKSVANLTEMVRADFEIVDVLYTTEVCMVARVSEKKHDTTYCMKVYSAAQVHKHNRTAQVLKEKNIHHHLSPLATIPGIAKTLKDDVSAGYILQAIPVCTLESCLQEPITEATASFYAAAVVLGFEHLHNENMLYRSLSPDTLLLDEDGHLIFVDFQFSKFVDGPTYTLCGNPEFLAPEVVENQGHSLSVDYWSLGVLIYYMLSCETPFATAEDTEIVIYSKITNREFQFPDKISSTARDLIDKLLSRDPNKRLGYGLGGVEALKKHAWFRSVDWEGLGSMMRDTVPVPAEMQERVRQFAKNPTGTVEEIPMETGYDQSPWMKDF